MTGSIYFWRIGCTQYITHLTGTCPAFYPPSHDELWLVIITTWPLFKHASLKYSWAYFTSLRNTFLPVWMTISKMLFSSTEWIDDTFFFINPAGWWGSQGIDWIKMRKVPIRRETLFMALERLWWLYFLYSFTY